MLKKKKKKIINFDLIFLIAVNCSSLPVCCLSRSLLKWFMILFKGGISEHTIFCLFRSGMENMKCRVTEVTVGGEAELLLDLYGGGTFYKE